MKKENLIEDQAGFTLIEIIAVLVIMGILAAVAVPKFFDLQAKARQKAIYTATSEMKVRVNQRFAHQLLEGVVVASIDFSEAGVGTNIGDDFLINGWDWTLGDTQVKFVLTYYPEVGTTQNQVVNSVAVDLPQVGT